MMADETELVERLARYCAADAADDEAVDRSDCSADPLTFGDLRALQRERDALRAALSNEPTQPMLDAGMVALVKLYRAHGGWLNKKGAHEQASVTWQAMARAALSGEAS